MALGDFYICEAETEFLKIHYATFVALGKINPPNMKFLENPVSFGTTSDFQIT